MVIRFLLSHLTKRPLEILQISGRKHLATPHPLDRGELAIAHITPKSGDGNFQVLRRLLGREIPFICADLLQGLDGSFDIITANPPYVTTRETAELLARGWKEPSLALDGGADGLDLVRRLVGQAKKALFPWGFLLVETDALQSETVRGMFMKEGFCEVRTWKDLAGLERITGARRP